MKIWSYCDPPSEQEALKKLFGWSVTCLTVPIMGNTLVPVLGFVLWDRLLTHKKVFPEWIMSHHLCLNIAWCVTMHHPSEPIRQPQPELKCSTCILLTCCYVKGRMPSARQLALVSHPPPSNRWGRPSQKLPTWMTLDTETLAQTGLEGERLAGLHGKAQTLCPRAGVFTL